MNAYMYTNNMIKLLKLILKLHFFELVIKKQIKGDQFRWYFNN